MSLRKTLKGIISLSIYNLRLDALVRAYRGASITILMYHKVNPVMDPVGLSVSPELFEQQLLLLKQSYNIISIDDALAQLNDARLTGHNLVITFDDGYLDNYQYAFPILKKLEAPACIFLATDAIDKGYFYWEEITRTIRGLSLPITIDFTLFGGEKLSEVEDQNELAGYVHRLVKELPVERIGAFMDFLASESNIPSVKRYMLSWDMIQKMHASGLITFGSHTETHPLMSKIHVDRVDHELKLSKSKIIDATKAPVYHFAYPNGKKNDYDSRVIDRLELHKYRAAYTSMPGIITNRSVHDLDNLYELPRIDVTPGMSQKVDGYFNIPLFVSKVSNLI